MKRYILFLFAISIIHNTNALEVTINGLNYFLYLQSHEATLTYGHTCSGELDIPSEISYNDETFVVKSMFVNSFYNNTELTKVRIPKTIENILHSYPYDSDDEDPPTGMVSPDHMNPFRECTALEAIEVDEENPSFKTIDGVLISKDGTRLYCYPIGKQQEAYSIPEDVEWIGANAFEGSHNLTTLTIPSGVTYIGECAFADCNNFTDVYCYAENVPSTGSIVFGETPTFFDYQLPIASATLHVPAGSVDKYKTTYPWSDFGNIVALPIEINENTFPDEYFRNWVLSKEYGKDGILTNEEIAGITKIIFNTNKIHSLKGIEYFTELTTLYCTANPLTELDVTKCTKLTYLECIGNQLTTLDVSKNTALTELNCSENPLKTLDISNNTQLVSLHCQRNELTALDVSNNTALETLSCNGNQLTELDVSKNKNLKRLVCSNNQLTGLELKSLPKLENLKCLQNRLERIIVSDCPKLEEIDCFNNQISGEAMDEFIEGLPVVPNGWGHLCIVDPENEQNVMTKAQVAAVKAKGWHPRYKYGSFGTPGYTDYEGIDEPVTFTAGQMATIILPTAPDASKGKYYRLDRYEDGQRQVRRWTDNL